METKNVLTFLRKVLTTPPWLQLNSSVSCLGMFPEQRVAVGNGFVVFM